MIMMTIPLKFERVINYFISPFSVSRDILVQQVAARWLESNVIMQYVIYSVSCDVAILSVLCIVVSLVSKFEEGYRLT